MSIGYFTRRETFAASHRLHVPSLTESENRALFGKCNNPHGHGHNYVLEVTVRGPIDAQTGLIINLAELKNLLAQHVLERVDHRHLNNEVPEFRKANPSAENLAKVIWEWLQPHLKGLLYEVRLCETENNYAIYRGE